MNSSVASVMTPLPLAVIAPVVFVAKRDAALVEAEQAPVRNGDTVGVARQIGEHRSWSGKGRLGVDRPAFLAHRRQVAEERPSICKDGEAAEEAELARIIQGQEPAQEHIAEQLAEHAHR